ncbi:MAG TPA: hypothetical protein VK395_27945 [Gemmataceae bacterium]|nr:hypothetical protein [Gemmataceae bacterium]
MIRYTVTWLEGAQNSLAQIWMDAQVRREVASAADSIDRELAKDPANKGTALSEGLRSLCVPPLHVLFSVSEPDRVVEVASVRINIPPPKSDEEGNGLATD